jgi:hypothetical protein
MMDKAFEGDIIPAEQFAKKGDHRQQREYSHQDSSAILLKHYTKPQQ